jgi:CRISPR-associated exonuclease Cas4
MKLTGSLIQAFSLCPRQAWLMSRSLAGDQQNEFLAIGRLYSKESYKREKKEVLVDGNKLDVVKNDNGTLTVIETKKSSRMLKTGKIQLLHYLYSLKKKGYSVKGEIRVPREKKIIELALDEEAEKELEGIYGRIESLIEQEKAPAPLWIGACRSCSYKEFCWA